MSKIPAQISSVFPHLQTQESQSLPAINLEAFCLSLPRCLDRWRCCSTVDSSFVFQLLGNRKMVQPFEIVASLGVVSWMAGESIIKAAVPISLHLFGRLLFSGTSGIKTPCSGTKQQGQRESKGLRGWDCWRWSSRTVPKTPYISPVFEGFCLKESYEQNEAEKMQY